jgi:hypothetical protein
MPRNEPGRRRRVRHRPPPYVIDITYADEDQEHEPGSTANRSNGSPTPMHHDEPDVHEPEQHT